jgi:hypothetical protein
MGVACRESSLCVDCRSIFIFASASAKACSRHRDRCGRFLGTYLLYRGWVSRCGHFAAPSPKQCPTSSVTGEGQGLPCSW